MESKVYNNRERSAVRDGPREVIHCDVFQGDSAWLEITYFECSKCGEKLTPDVARNVCPKDGGPLYVRYDLAKIRQSTSRDSVKQGPTSMWRYAAVLPDADPVTSGRGH